MFIFKLINIIILLGWMIFILHAANAADIMHLTKTTKQAIPKHQLFNKRYSIVNANGPFSIAPISKPGYYTIILFSTNTCSPCKKLWNEIILLTRKYTNIVAIKVNITPIFNSATTNSVNTKFLSNIGIKQVPGIYLVGPFGQTIGFASGVPDIIKILNNLNNRVFKYPIRIYDVVPIDKNQPNKFSPEQSSGVS